MKKITSLLGALNCLVVLGTCVARGDAAPLAITPGSFNATAVASAANPIPDGFAGDSFYDATLAAAASLPASGEFPTLTDTGVSGNVYDFAPATGNDSLEGNGTLTFATPVSGLSTLYILGTASNGGVTGNVTLTFAGNVTYETSITFSDWGGDNGDINGLGRVSQTTPPHQDAGLIFALFDPSISIPTADQHLALESVTYAQPASGAQPEVIFAVDGAVAIPEPSTYALLGLGVAAMALVLRNRRPAQV